MGTNKQCQKIKNGKRAGISPAHFFLPAITAVSAAAAIPAGLIYCFVYPKLAAVKFAAIGAGNSSCGLFIGAHFDKSEAFGVAIFTIEDDLGGGYTAKLGEQSTETVFSCVVREITDIQFLSH